MNTSVLPLCLCASVVLLSSISPDAAAQPADLHGDPLPGGAIARIGTARWRIAECPLLFTSDGKLAVADCAKPGLIDAASGKILRQLGEESYRSFLLPDDKTLLVTGGPKVGLRYLDIHTGKVLRRLPIEGYQCTWSKDGKRMASLLFDDKNRRTITVWDLDSGKAMQTWDKSFGDVLLSPDGNTLALRDNDSISIYDVHGGRELRRWQSAPPSNGRTGNARIMQFSPDGKILACTEAQKRVTLWNPANGDVTGVLKTERDGPTTLTFSRDGRHLAAGGSAGNVYVWEIATSKLVRMIENAGDQLPIYVLDFTPDAKTLISQAHLFPSARVWDVPTGKELSPIDANSARVDAIAFSPDSKTLASVGPGDPISLWEARTGKLVKRLPTPRYMGLNHGGALAFTPDGKAVGMHHYHFLSHWNIANAKAIYQSRGTGPHQVSPGEDTNRIAFPNCAFDETSMLVLLGELKKPPFMPFPPPPTTTWNVIAKWDAKAYLLKTLVSIESANLTRLDMAPDRKLVVAAGQLFGRDERTLFAWDIERGGELFRLPLTDTHVLDGASFSRDSRTIYLTQYQNEANDHRFRLEFVEAITGAKRLSVSLKIEGPHIIRGVVAHERLAAIASWTELLLFDPLSNQVLHRVKLDAPISCLKFSPDQRLLATGCEDTTALVWDVEKLAPPGKAEAGKFDLGDAWGKLRGNDAEASFRAIVRMSESPDAVRYLSEKLKPVAVVPPEQIRRLANQLNSKVFAEREQASKELARLGEIVEPELENVVKNPASLETRRRAEDLLKELRDRRSKGPFTLVGDELREARAIETLERSASAEAERILARLASGSPVAPLTRQARAAHERLTTKEPRSK